MLSPLKSLSAMLGLLLLGAMACDLPAASPDPIPYQYTALSIDQLKSNSGRPSYRQLMRNIEDHEGELVWYEGEISQVLTIDIDAYQVVVRVTKCDYF